MTKRQLRRKVFEKYPDARCHTEGSGTEKRSRIVCGDFRNPVSLSHTHSKENLAWYEVYRELYPTEDTQ